MKWTFTFVYAGLASALALNGFHNNLYERDSTRGIEAALTERDLVEALVPSRLFTRSFATDEEITVLGQMIYRRMDKGHEDSKRKASSSPPRPETPPPGKKLKINTDVTQSPGQSSPPGRSPKDIIKDGGLKMIKGGPGQAEQSPSHQKSEEYSSKSVKLTRRPTDGELGKMGFESTKTFVKDVHENGNSKGKAIGDATISTKTAKGKDGKERTYVAMDTSRIRKETGEAPSTPPGMGEVKQSFTKLGHTHGEFGANKQVNEAHGLPAAHTGESDGRTMSFNTKNAKGDVTHIVPQESCPDCVKTNKATGFRDIGAGAGTVKDNRERVNAAADKNAEQLKIIKETIAKNKPKTKARRAVVFRRALENAFVRRCEEESMLEQCHILARRMLIPASGSLMDVQRRSIYVEAY